MGKQRQNPTIKSYYGDGNSQETNTEEENDSKTLKSNTSENKTAWTEIHLEF